MKPADYTFEKLTALEARWYGVNEDCFIVRFKKGAPINKLASIVSGKYASNSKTGYIHGNGNTGTMSAILKDISILNDI